MYFEQTFGDRTYLVYQDEVSRHRIPYMIALAHEGLLMTSEEYDHGRDFDAVEAFKDAHGLRLPERRRP